MAIQRMDNVLIVVEDLDAMIGFFTGIGMELEGRTHIEGDWVDGVIGIEGAREEIALLRTPDGHGAVELAKFLAPAAITPEPAAAPVNTLGLRRIMFAVDDVDAAVERLLADGAELVGTVVRYLDAYRLCFVRGPEGVLVGLAEPLNSAEPGGTDR
ncbi:VOC family protein [Nocardiopsis coralliicola]